MNEEIAADLPGVDLVSRGLQDLREGVVESVPALLVAIGAPRLRRLGLPVPPDTELPPDPEKRLYRFLAQESGDDAHSRYNALLRRLVSFERALEASCARNRRQRPQGPE